MVHLFSWFGTYCLCRTLSNSTEHALLIIGTYYLCRRHYLSKILFFSISNFSVGMWIATFSVFVRPTIAMLWVIKLHHVSVVDMNFLSSVSLGSNVSVRYQTRFENNCFKGISGKWVLGFSHRTWLYVCLHIVSCSSSFHSATRNTCGHFILWSVHFYTMEFFCLQYS